MLDVPTFLSCCVNPIPVQVLIDCSREPAPQCKTMAETVIVCSLVLMEAYWSINASCPTYCSIVIHHLFHVQPVSGVINKDCTEAECLYSSQCGCLKGDTDLWSCEGTGACELPTHHQPPPSITACNSYFPIRPSAWRNTHEQLLSPPEIVELLLPLLTGRSSV